MNKRAEELGVKITPSKKYLDVYDWNGNYICSIKKSKDYFFYLKKYGNAYAEYKRNQPTLVEISQRNQ